MKLGSSRWGNDFETKVREFIVKYGFEIIAENETIPCIYEAHEKKGKQHEIDVIANYTSPGYPLPPIYGPDINEKFLISSKGGVQIGEKEITEAKQQIECLQAINEYKDVNKLVIICEHSTTTFPDDQVYVWDE